MAMLMAAERAHMTMTVSEVYFLVRVGSWGEDSLEAYINECVEEMEEQTYDHGYKEGYKEGHEDGWTEGRVDLQKEAVQAMRDLI